MTSRNTILSNKKITVPIMIFSIVCAVVIILAVINHIQSNTQTQISREPYIDPISGEEIYDPNLQTGGPQSNPNEPPIIGINQLIDRGITKEQVNDIKRIISSYYKENKKEDVVSISYYKNSYKNISKDDSQRINSIKFAINNDQSKNIYMKIIRYSVDKYDILLYSDEQLQNEVYKYNFCSVLVCKPEVPTNNSLPEDYAG